MFSKLWGSQIPCGRVPKAGLDRSIEKERTVPKRLPGAIADRPWLRHSLTRPVERTIHSEQTAVDSSSASGSTATEPTRARRYGRYLCRLQDAAQYLLRYCGNGSTRGCLHQDPRELGWLAKPSPLFGALWTKAHTPCALKGPRMELHMDDP